jgi:RNA polymerase sigma-70 factor (ECF subfamily)
MTKNMVYNKLKKSGVHSRFVDATRSNQANQDPEKKIITRDLLQHIHKEMGNLPKQQRDIYEMNREEDLTYNEISDKLGISPKTVQYHIGKVLIKLKKTISS